ncbi:MAG: winged helix-turn-helix domain-containing protein [Woeseiaceae bacterium]
MPIVTDLMRGFDFGPWHVIPERGLIREGDVEHHLEPLVMDVFVVLASHDGEVVTKDQLIEEVWDGRPQTDDVITRCISALRKGLRDDAKHPKYIQTVQRRGYRVMLKIGLSEAEPGAEVSTAAPPSAKPDIWVIAVGFLAVAAIAWFALMRPTGTAVDADGLASIAVYPFNCLQASSESSEHLCFGFAEEAISNLKQVNGTQIIRKRTPYGTENDSFFSTEDNIVSGSVQIIAGQVKVSVQLENADDNVVIWSETFDDDINGIFGLQRRVAAQLRAAIDDSYTIEGGDDSRQTNYAAAEAYALGRYLFENRDHDSIVEAISQFEEAIRLDPEYGPAWLGLAYTYSIWPDYDPAINRWRTFARALEIMEEGVEADPSIRTEAATVFGYIYHKQNRWGEAVENTTAAVNAESPSADAYHWHSRVLASIGRLDDSLRFARMGAELDPEYPVLMSRLAISYLWVNDLASAERYFNIANRMELGASVHALAYSLYLLRTEQPEDAIARIEQGVDALNFDSSWVAPVVNGIADESVRADAIALMDEVYATGNIPDNAMMTISVLLGNTDRAMEVALASETEGAEFELEITYIDEFTEFRQHPQYGEFVAKVGLQSYWDEAGCTWRDDSVICPP